QASPAEDQLIGIEFMINDDDNGGDRDKKLSWTSTSDDAWQIPSMFGTAKLGRELIVTGLFDNNADAIGSQIRCYPNPSTSEFTVAVDGSFSYQLMNQMGQV